MAEQDESASKPSNSITSSEQQRSTTVTMEASYVWAAPLPPPAILKQYNEVFPGCAERIVALAEHQALHRQGMEAKVILGNVRSQATGMWLGFTLALIVILSGAWLVYTGHIGWGAFFTGFPLISLVSVFVIGKQQQRRQLKSHEGQPEPTQRELPFPE